MSPMKNNGKLTGKKYWRSLDELADKPEFKDWLHREFPQGASELNNNWSRRNFLTLMGASLALAGLSSCRRPEEKIVPYVKQPEEITPGIPLDYATTMPSGTSPIGLLVQAHEGRPVKIEGNPLHPSSQGATNARMQAAILDLYDPDRSPYVMRDAKKNNWAEFVTFWRERFVEFEENDGEGLAVLTDEFSSPTLARLRREFTRRFPNARFVSWAPTSDENISRGYRTAFNADVTPVYHYDRAKVILSLDSDFLLTESENVAATKGFAAGRRIESEKDEMNRLYVVEPIFSITGASADHRLRVKASEVGAFALALAGELKKQGVDVRGIDGLTTPAAPGKGAQWLLPLAKDLVRVRGESLVVAGKRQPAAVHALVAAINDALDNLGNTMTLVANDDAARSDSEAFGDLVTAMNNGEVSSLVMLGVNPVYNAPADVDFASALNKVTHTVHVGNHLDETGEKTKWHIPRAHFLESWGDARAVDGTLSVVQPLIEPLFGGKSDIEILSLLAGGDDNRGYDAVRKTWRRAISGNFENGWKKVLHDGVLADSRTEPSNRSIRRGDVATILKDHQWSGNSSDLEIVFHDCFTVGDGRQANNGWLQELPDPITKLAWDNVATFAPKTAREMGIQNEDVVKITHDGRELEVAAWIVPGQIPGTVGLALGYGRAKAGRVAAGVGFDTFKLRTSSAMHFASGAQAARTGRTYKLATVQDHGAMEGRPIVREATLTEYRQNPDFATEAFVVPEMPEDFVKNKPKREGVDELPSPWEEPSYDTGYQWGMSIDLSTCTGCNACTVACQSENNIPIVGKEQTRNGREMHWIRIDRYFTGDADEPEAVHQAMACQHCENAPCEQVCPVAATVHDSEGLNLMVYNRCIGTRYCSNNCPYKVRRFNFFNYTNEYPEIVKMAQNPDVTVRSRGVMEKCTYCLQRINRGKKKAKLDGRELRDGEVISACQQACPADAIVFGDINDKDSRVSKLKRLNRTYSLLGELNTQPRTTYLGKIRNPNPEIMA